LDPAWAKSDVNARVRRSRLKAPRMGAQTALWGYTNDGGTMDRPQIVLAGVLASPSLRSKKMKAILARRAWLSWVASFLLCMVIATLAGGWRPAQR